MAPLNQRVFVWGRPVMLVLWLGSFLFFAGFVPPPGPISRFVLQIVIVGVAILRYARSEPILPRWSGYLSLRVAILITPGAFLVFFISGPLAWDGLFAWWIPLSVFGLWVLVMTWFVRTPNTQQAGAAVEPSMP